MMIEFIDRQAEIERLKKLSLMQSPLFIVITGRRRVGKTRLVREFIRDIEDSLYLFVEEKRGDVLLEEWSRETAEGVVFTSWDAFLRSVLGKYSVVVIDEFQNFQRVDPSFFSTLQMVLDEEDRRAMLIVLGSYIGMMNRIFEERKSPLFGRASEVWRLPPLPVGQIFQWVRGSTEEKVSLYSMFGGYPKYYVMLTQYGIKGAEDAWKQMIIPKYAPLSSEPYTILLQEFGGEYRAHFSIIEAVARGKRTYTEISDYTHISSTVLPRYLDSLIQLEILEKRHPITEGPRSKKARYMVRDEFVGFWFRYIFPNMNLREMERYDALYTLIKQDFPAYVGPRFEDMVRDLLRENWEHVGSWWNRRGDEIDIVATNEKKKEILFGEVKWTNRPVGWNIVEELMEKKELVQWHNGERKERFLVVSKAGFTKKCMERMEDEGIMHWDVGDVGRRIMG